MRRAAALGDFHAEAAADADFHGRIIEIAGNATLVRVWRHLEPFSRTYITLVVPGADAFRIADLHPPVLEALRRRDPDEAAMALRQHFVDAGAMLAQLWTDRVPVVDAAGRLPGRTIRLTAPTSRKDTMNDQLQLSEEMSAGTARLRVDVYGSAPLEHVLDDMSFLNYRLADVRISPAVTLPEPDIAWLQDGERAIAYDGCAMRFTGPWPAGPIQKVVVTMLALRMEAVGLHPFHASAVRYRGQTVLFLGGESNHGKSMGQIEACRRGGQLVSTETTVIDEGGVVIMGSKSVFLKKRTEGTERADKAAPERGVEKFFGDMPTWEQHDEPTNVDIVIVPAIDGNFDPSTGAMIPFERQFQVLHSLQNYFLTNELLAPGWPMPVVDTDPLRRARAAFVERFCERPFYFIRAATPQVLLDEVDRIL